MLNKCEFIGFLGNDVEVRAIGNGKEVVNLSLGVSERWKDREGNQQGRTEWVRATVFSEELVKICKNYLKKGSKIFLSGKMQTRKYQDKNGVDKYATEIVLSGFNGSIIMLDGKGDEKQESGGFTGKTDDDLDDSIPF